MANKSQNILNKILRGYLIFGSIYMLTEALIHFSNLRLLDSISMWSDSALAYSVLMTKLYASFALFFAILLFFIQKDMRKYELIIKILAVFSLLHTVVLIYLSLTENFYTSFGNLTSLSFWIPEYNLFLIFEAVLLFSFSILVFFWQKNLNN